MLGAELWEKHPTEAWGLEHSDRPQNMSEALQEKYRESIFWARKIPCSKFKGVEVCKRTQKVMM